MAKADNDNDQWRALRQAVRQSQASIPESTRDAVRRSIETARKYGPDPAQMRAIQEAYEALRRQLEDNPNLRRFREDMRRLQQGDAAKPPPAAKTAVAHRKARRPLIAEDKSKTFAQQIINEGRVTSVRGRAKELIARLEERNIKMSPATARRRFPKDGP
jgi:hypothetical protein